MVLADKQRTTKWLAEQLGKDPATVSKWCTNASQPDWGEFDVVIDVIAKSGDDFEDGLNHLAIVKDNIEKEARK